MSTSGVRVVPIAPDAGRGAFLSPEAWATRAHPSLADAGYRVEEFLVEGRARIRAADAAPGDPREPYATRVLAIRPRDDADFSGVVHLELLNPSTGEDFPMFWPDAGAHLMARGDAYLGITCKRVTADHLRGHDPQRYGAVRIRHDSVVWDLLGDVARACHETGAGGLLPGLRAPVRRLATGWSQSGSFLRTYLSERMHDEHSAALPAGGRIIDGYLIGVSSGGFGPMGYVEPDRDGEIEFDADFRPLRPGGPPVPMDDARRILLHAPVPVIEYMSEDEAVHHVWHRRPDSDVAGDHYRCYQVPGRGHETGLLRTSERVPGASDDEDPPRHASSRAVLAAVLTHLVAWTDGVLPPRADPIRVDVGAPFRRDPDGLDYAHVRLPVDGLGHALGGVRHLEVDLPTHRWGIDPAGPSTMRSWRALPLSGAELVARYGAADAYLRAIRARAAQLVALGWLLPEHVEDAVRDARRRYARATA